MMRGRGPILAGGTWRRHSTAIKPWGSSFVGGTIMVLLRLPGPTFDADWCDYLNTDHQPVDCTCKGRQHVNGEV